MKRLFQFGFCLLLILNCIQATAQRDELIDSISYLNCLAVNGLSLRNYPSKNSIRMGIIPYGDSMRLISNSGVKERLKGFKGEWIQVNYKGLVGYVFNVYTSKYPTPILKEYGYSYFKDYLFGNFRLTKGAKNFGVDDNGIIASQIRSEFGEIEYIFNNQEHEEIEIILIPNGDIQECFILFTACNFIFRKYTLENSKFKKEIQKDGTVEYKYSDLKNPENSSEGYVYTYRLNEQGDYIALEIDFEWDLGGSWFKCEKLENQAVKISHGFYSH